MQGPGERLEHWNDSNRIISLNSSIEDVQAVSAPLLVNWNGRVLQVLNPDLAQNPTWSIWTLSPKLGELQGLPNQLSRLIERIGQLLTQNEVTECLNFHANQLDERLSGQANHLGIRETLADQRTIPLLSFLLKKQIELYRDIIRPVQSLFSGAAVVNLFFPNNADQRLHFLDLLSYPFSPKSSEPLLSTENLNNRLYQAVRECFFEEIRPEMIKEQFKSWLLQNRYEGDIDAFLQQSVILENGQPDRTCLESLYNDVFCHLDAIQDISSERIINQLALIKWDEEKLFENVCDALVVAHGKPAQVSWDNLRETVVEWLRPTRAQQRINIVNSLLTKFSQEHMPYSNTVSFDKIVSQLNSDWICASIPIVVQSLLASLNEESSLMEQLPANWQNTRVFKKQEKTPVERVASFYYLLQSSQITPHVDEVSTTRHTKVEITSDLEGLRYVINFENTESNKIHNELAALLRQTPTNPISLTLNATDSNAINQLLEDLKSNPSLQNRIDILEIKAEKAAGNAFLSLLPFLPNLKALTIHRAMEIDEECFSIIGKCKFLTKICFDTCCFRNGGHLLSDLHQGGALQSLEILKCSGLNAAPVSTFIKEWKKPQERDPPTLNNAYVGDLHHLLLNGTDLVLTDIETAASDNHVCVFHESYAGRF